MGTHAIYVCALTAGFDLDSFTMTAVETEREGGAYDNTPAIIPGTVEGELYDSGGQGVAYSDTDAANVGQVSSASGLSYRRLSRYTSRHLGINNLDRSALLFGWTHARADDIISSPHEISLRSLIARRPFD